MRELEVLGVQFAQKRLRDLAMIGKTIDNMP